ncbi:MAG: bifunctional 5,10-methylenetetrahydrofolate dehydrogenase/5,10-methenyltetrahydrofolate cyclohydrolase [Blastochloris sp.]|nr:bifunctional 5,10-methylenetetrahydrofolate dehydrogenase/5,10-methenyltetrahydrofolate cyclohydrolase [Blastochloris sp.]
MTATIIDGNVVAGRLRADLATEAARFVERHGYPPGLGVVLVGDNPASAQYVRMKRRASEQVGIASYAHLLPADATQVQVEAAVQQLNDDPKVHGILVQLPLPGHLDENAVLGHIALEKDADGLHPVNMGALGMKGREALYTPATPTGCMILLREIGAQIEGANAVVLGRSNIVGLPIALMLIKENATVTVCHSRTKHLPHVIRQADILIAAIGRPNYVQAEWIRPGAVVIDVGSNRIDDAHDPRGYRFVGDVDFDAAREVAGAITIVPGGVGPMTITALMMNTIKAAWRQTGP